MSDIQSFSFHGQSVQTVEIDNQTWWVAKDVAEILEYTDAQAMTKRLEDFEVQNRQFVGFGNRGINLINESGLYTAILGSNKPKAKIFKRWVTSEVLPQIRKTGGYGVAKPDDVIKNRYIALLEKHNDLLIDLTLYKEQLRNNRKRISVSHAEQLQIKAMYEQGFQTGEIARELDRNKSTIRRHKNLLALGGAVNHD